MADLNMSATRRKHRGVRRTKKLSTRVDLTPMVDLGFLLITFFIYSTTMAKPRAMRLILPADGVPAAAAESSVITLLLGKNNTIFYYEGIDPSNGHSTDYANIRHVILDKKLRTNPTWFQVILKPTADCTYGNTVDILDEMKIDAVHHYVLTDPSPFEYQTMKAHF